MRSDFWSSEWGPLQSTRPNGPLPKFFYHKGIKAATGRSLLDENKSQYDELAKTQQLRHRVAHTGVKPSIEEARDAHKLCCVIVQWFAALGNMPVKPLVPDTSNSNSRIVAGIMGGCNQFIVDWAPSKSQKPTLNMDVSQVPTQEGQLPTTGE